MSRNRKMICLISVWVIIFSVIPYGVAETVTPMRNMCEGLVKALNIYEHMYSDIEWYHQYLYEFDKTKQWADLQKTRMALSTVLLDLRNMVPETIGISEQDCIAIDNENGFDVSFMTFYDAEIAEEKNRLVECCLNEIYALTYSIFTGKEWNQRIEANKIEDQADEAILHFYAYTVDWVTTKVKGTEWETELNAQINEYCPRISSYRIKGPFTEEICEAYGNESLDRYEELISQLKKNVGKHEFTYDRFERFVELRTDEELLNDKMEIKGLPVLLPFATWYGEPVDRELSYDETEVPDWSKWIVQDYFYYWQEGDQEIKLAKVGDEIDRPPEGCMIITQKVGREEVAAYCESLKTYGIEPREALQEEGTISVIYVIADSILAIEWEDNTARITLLKNPVCFADKWYIDSVYAAQNP